MTEQEAFDIMSTEMKSRWSMWFDNKYRTETEIKDIVLLLLPYTKKVIIEAIRMTYRQNSSKPNLAHLENYLKRVAAADPDFVKAKKEDQYDYDRVRIWLFSPENGHRIEYHTMPIDEMTQKSQYATPDILNKARAKCMVLKKQYNREYLVVEDSFAKMQERFIAISIKNQKLNKAPQLFPEPQIEPEPPKDTPKAIETILDGIGALEKEDEKELEPVESSYATEDDFKRWNQEEGFDVDEIF